MENQKIKLTNPSQFKKLVEELEKNPELARGFRRGTIPVNFKEQWECIATALNSLGPPIRISDGWQKIWRDLKFKVKRKLTKNKAECKATGGGVFQQVILSPLELAVANILQFQKRLYPEGMVQGVKSSESELLPEMECSIDLNLLDLVEMENAPKSKVTSPLAATAPSASAGTQLAGPLTATAPSKTTVTFSAEPSTSKALGPSTNSFPSPFKRKLNMLRKNESPEERHELLENHTTNQARILTEISNSVMSMKRALRDVKDIAVKRLKLESERNKREEEMYLTDMKIKRIELEIKQRELQLLNE